MKYQFKNPVCDMSTIAILGIVVMIVLSMSSCSTPTKQYEVANIASITVKTVDANGIEANEGDMVKIDSNGNVINACHLSEWEGKKMEENRWVVLEVVE